VERILQRRLDKGKESRGEGNRIRREGYGGVERVSADDLVHMRRGDQSGVYEGVDALDY
jgi:hypothetical protein